MQMQRQATVLHLSEAVTAATISAADIAAFQAACTDPALTQIDLSGVTQADSVCVCLLISALRSRQNGTPLQPVHLPDSVRALIHLYEIDHWMLPA